MRAADKRIYLIIMTALTVAGFIVICTLGQSVHRRRQMAKTAEITERVTARDSIVREYNGRIGVFRTDSPTPYRIIDYNINLLSDYDREQLKYGITITGDRELQQFIEDIAT